MNKTDRKNKTNLNVTWPAVGGCFTLTDLMALNPGFIQITLRVRLDNAIKKDKSVTLIGYKNFGKGRPKMILAMSPITQELLDKAYAEGVQPPEVRPIVSAINSATTVSTTEEKSTSTEVSVDVSDPVHSDHISA